MSTIAVASNPFERYKGIQKPEEKRNRKVETSGLETLLGKFEQMLGYAESYVGHKLRQDVKKKIAEEVADVLTPDYISRFLHSTIKYEGNAMYHGGVGIFLSQLVQNSYDSGHNDFRINTKSISQPINLLCSDLKGTDKNPISVTIDGNVGYSFGDNAEHAAFTVNGNAGEECGMHARHIDINISGNAETWLGNSADSSTFHIYGHYYYHHFGFNRFYSHFTTDCTFKIHSRKVFDTLKEVLPRSRNKIILLDGKGNVVEEWM